MADLNSFSQLSNKAHIGESSTGQRIHGASPDKETWGTTDGNYSVMSDCGVILCVRVQPANMPPISRFGEFCRRCFSGSAWRALEIVLTLQAEAMDAEAAIAAQAVDVEEALKTQRVYVSNRIAGILDAAGKRDRGPNFYNQQLLALQDELTGEKPRKPIQLRNERGQFIKRADRR